MPGQAGIANGHSSSLSGGVGQQHSPGREAGGGQAGQGCCSIHASSLPSACQCSPQLRQVCWGGEGGPQHSRAQGTGRVEGEAAGCIHCSAARRCTCATGQATARAQRHHHIALLPPPHHCPCSWGCHHSAPARSSWRAQALAAGAGSPWLPAAALQLHPVPWRKGPPPSWGQRQLTGTVPSPSPSGASCCCCCCWACACRPPRLPLLNAPHQHHALLPLPSPGRGRQQHHASARAHKARGSGSGSGGAACSAPLPSPGIARCCCEHHAVPSAQPPGQGLQARAAGQLQAAQAHVGAPAMALCEAQANEAGLHRQLPLPQHLVHEQGRWRGGRGQGQVLCLEVGEAEGAGASGHLHALGAVVAVVAQRQGEAVEVPLPQAAQVQVNGLHLPGGGLAGGEVGLHASEGAPPAIGPAGGVAAAATGCSAGAGLVVDSWGEVCARGATQHAGQAGGIAAYRDLRGLQGHHQHILLPGGCQGCRLAEVQARCTPGGRQGARGGAICIREGVGGAHAHHALASVIHWDGQQGGGIQGLEQQPQGVWQGALPGQQHLVAHLVLCAGGGGERARGSTGGATPQQQGGHSVPARQQLQLGRQGSIQGSEEGRRICRGRGGQGAVQAPALLHKHTLCTMGSGQQRISGLWHVASDVQHASGRSSRVCLGQGEGATSVLI